MQWLVQDLTQDERRKISVIVMDLIKSARKWVTPLGAARGCLPLLFAATCGPLGPRPRPYESESLADSLGLLAPSTEPLVAGLCGYPCLRLSR